jgi:hypothetical protein
MSRILFGVVGVALLAAACAQMQSGNVTLSEAERCAQSGGLWRPALEMCERSAAGGGGY